MKYILFSLLFIGSLFAQPYDTTGVDVVDLNTDLISGRTFYTQLVGDSVKAGGTLLKIGFHRQETGNMIHRFALYADNSTTVGTLLDSTLDHTENPTAGDWVDVAVVTGARITGGTNYWVGSQVSGPRRWYYQTGHLYHYKTEDYDTEWATQPTGLSTDGAIWWAIRLITDVDTIYIDADKGVDTNQGSSILHPLKTINPAFDDTVNIVNASVVNALPDETELPEKAENYFSRLKKYV